MKPLHIKRQEIIEQLELLSEDFVPEEITKVKDEELVALLGLVNSILDKERSGIDRMLESISQTLRYIPNFLILAITNKYIDPTIAARITAKLPLKQSVSIAKGLPADYIGEAAVFMSPDLACNILNALPRKNARLMIRYLFTAHPLRVLDIFSDATKGMFKLEGAPSSFLQMERLKLNDQRARTLDEFIKYQ